MSNTTHIQPNQQISKLLKPKKEAEIMATWQGDHNIPVISICCVTYNQENYIQDAINGFLTQQTTIPFEILIHDDV